jgi:hypothetical protein
MLGYSTIRVNTTVLGQPLRFAYRTCWQHMEDVPNKPGLVALECFNLTRTAMLMDPLGTRAPAPAPASVATNSVFFPVVYSAKAGLTVAFLTTWPEHTGGFTIQIVELSGATGAAIVANLTATAMDPIAAEAVLASLPWERTTYQDTKILGERYSMAKSVNFFPEPPVLNAESFVFGEMWPTWQIKANTSYLYRIEHVDSNIKAWEDMRDRKWNGGFRAQPQKVKLLSFSSC